MLSLEISALQTAEKTKEEEEKLLHLASSFNKTIP
jgi:hypothetical protein